MVVGPIIVPRMLCTNQTWFVLERGREKKNKESRGKSVTQVFKGQAGHGFDPVGSKASGHAGLHGKQRKHDQPRPRWERQHHSEAQAMHKKPHNVLGELEGCLKGEPRSIGISATDPP